MKKFKIQRTLLLLFLLVSMNSIAQTINYYKKALDILRKSKLVMGECESNITISYKGVIHNLGHYESPEKTEDIPLGEKYGFFKADRTNYLYSEILSSGRIFKRTSVTKADSLYNWGYFDQNLTKSTSGNFSFEIAKTFPPKLLDLAFENRMSLRFMGEYLSYYLLSFNYAQNASATIFINKESYLLEKVETLDYNDMYGDVTNETFYRNFKDTLGIKVPGARLDYEYGLLERELNYSSINLNFKLDTSNFKFERIPPSFALKQAEQITSSEKFEFMTITPEIDLVKIMSQNNKVLIAKFADFIALLETPKGIELNRQLMKELAIRYPKKPVRYILITHHHPDHAGGIRAYANQSITVITTLGNKEYFSKLLKTPHSIKINEPMDDFSNISFEFVPLKGQKILKEKGNEIVAYETGSATTHTAEYLNYYFPKSKILWTGDLIIFDQKETQYPAGARGKSVLDLIVDKKLDVNKIYTSWPLHDQKDFGTIEFLKKLLDSK